MGSLSSRLDRLEAKASPPQPQGDALIRLRVLITANERHRATARGEELPPYSPDELEEMHLEDLEIVAGRGVVGWLQNSKGWEDEESRAFLDFLQDQARHRLDGGGATE
jgi:hypothetical protein